MHFLFFCFRPLDDSVNAFSVYISNSVLPSRINNSVIKIWQTEGAKGFDCNSCRLDVNSTQINISRSGVLLLTASDIFIETNRPKTLCKTIFTHTSKLLFNSCRRCHTCIRDSKFVPQDPRRVKENFLIKDIFLVSTWTAEQWNCPQL